MKIAYFSPLNPQKSGISDFSEELLPYLKKLMDIDLYVDNYKPSLNNVNDYGVYNIDDYEIKMKEYDSVIFHVGNNAKYHSKIIDTFLKFGGILELHDISLHNYIAGITIDKNKPEEYIELMKYSHGYKGEKAAKDYLNGLITAPWEDSKCTFTVNKHLVDKAKAIIVHSDFAKQTLKGINPEKKIINIAHHTADLIAEYDSYKNYCRKKLNIKNNLFIIGSFGFATESKRIVRILEALSIMRKQYKNEFHYYIVGEIDSDNIIDKINELQLNDYVTITGFTNLELFKLYMGACDFCINLRYPTYGESSGSVHRMFGMGKPVIVTSIGTFEEYPDNIVIKVPYGESEVNEIYKAINKLFSDKTALKDMSKNAYEYAVSKCNIEINAKKYYKFFEDIISEKYEEDYIDYFIDKLFKLGLTDDFYLDYLLKNKFKA